ncbi:hypothetical protein IJ096_00065 [Candidatus Saccharibacteria bacterium]|nr:hypothetical protein [Candidatus Saccharibacteria bacterium]
MQRLNQTKYQYSKNLAIFSGATLLFGGVCLLQPFSFTENTNATTERTTNGDYYIETTTTDLNLSIHTTPAGAQETASHDVIVKTDDPAGFTLTVSVNNDTSNALNLGGSTSATEKFNATSGTYTSPAALDDNAWGFADTLTKKDNDQWAAVPLLSSAQQIKQTSSATPSGDTTTVHYGIKAKYDGKHSNGNYSNVITYSVVGNTPPVKDLDDITYFQDVDTYSSVDLCGNSTTWTSGGKEYTLKDKRDNLSYKVRKLADGHCWMAQNFRMTKDTLSANNHSATLDSSDTDISNSKSPSTFEMPDNKNWSGSASDHLLKGAADATKLPVDSSSGTPASGETAVARGAYYSWCTATADCTNDVSTGIHQENSICPKGWKLPDSDGSTSASTNQFRALYNKYNSAASFNQAFNTYYSSGATYYLAGAWYSDSAQYVKFVGSGGYWWSSTSHSSNANRVWLLLAGTSTIYPADSYGTRHIGYSMRCVLGS